MHKVLFEIGDFTVYTYGFFAALAFVLFVILARKGAVKYGLPADKITDSLAAVLLAGVAGSRLLYVAINWRDYSGDLLRIFALREGGMAFQGGLILAAIVGFAMCRLNKLSFLLCADLVAPYIPLGHAAGRIGCFFNGCCYGKICDGPLGVIFPGESSARLPAQLYEAALLLALLVFLFFLRNKLFSRGPFYPSGGVLAAYFSGYGLVRFIVDFTRGDNPVVFGGLLLSQIISVALFIGGAVCYDLAYFAARKRNKSFFK